MKSKRMVLASILGGGALLLCGAVVHAEDDRASASHRYHNEFLNHDQEDPRWSNQDEEHHRDGRYEHSRDDEYGRHDRDDYDRHEDERSHRRSSRYDRHEDERYRSPRYNREEWREYQRRVADIRHEYEKAMQRLDRQERESRAWVYRHYGPSHPRFHDRMAKVDRKFAHKREKVERRAERQYQELAKRYGTAYARIGYGGWNNALTRR